MSLLMQHGIMMAASGPPPGPSIEIVATSSSTAVTPFAVAMPAVVDAGDLLVVVLAIQGGVGSVAASGWTQRQSAVQGASVTNILAYSRVASGTEGGTTVNFTHSSARIYSGVCLRVPAAYVDSAQAPASAIFGKSSAASPNPPNLTPSWGSANNIWLAIFVASNSGSEVTAFPYPDGNFDYSSDPSGSLGSSQQRVAGCYTRTAAASLDPPAFTTTGSSTWIAMTMAIKPP